jgi:NAD(P)-dependent dehydrogenase (short-subunit alcohol dehydrogenase family)
MKIIKKIKKLFKSENKISNEVILRYNEKNQLKDKIVLVTGAGKGIGREIAKCFARQGAKVFLNSRTLNDLENLKKEIETLGGKCHYFVGDITQNNIVKNMFSELKSHYGKLDICINSAGTAKFGSIENFSKDEFQKLIDINLGAVYSCIQESVKLMKTNGDQGKIITIGSVASHWSERGGDGSYAASKYGVHGMTEAIARQLHGTGSKISVSLLCPGVVDTPLTNSNKDPKPDWLRPETIAESALHIATAPANVNIFNLTIFGTEEKPFGK